MRILVTGGAGFIGSHVVERLVRDGHEVRALDNLSTGRWSNLDGFAGEVELIEADLRELAGVRAAARRSDAIVHLAAVPSVPRSIADPLTTHTANANGTLNVLVAARDADVRRVVFSSSSSIYGAARGLPKRESLKPLPISPYAASKLAAESYCQSFYEVFGLETVALRYFNVFGPRQDPQSQYAAVIPKFIWAYSHEESPVIFGDGNQSRDFTYVDNVVTANMLALTRENVGGRVYNIACGERVTLNQLATILREQTGARVKPIHGPSRPGDVRHSLADIKLARRELGYEPSISLEEGLRRTVKHASRARSDAARRASLRPVQRANGPPRARAQAGNGNGRARRRPPRRRRYLITGGAGFIGSHLAETLLDEKRCTSLTLLDDLSAGDRQNVAHLLGRGAELVVGSISDRDCVEEVMKDADVCVHLASAVGVQRIVNNPLETLSGSVEGSSVVMDAAARHGVRLLFSSTSEVYGKQTSDALTEHDDLVLGSPSKGRWTYAIAKVYGEALLAAYHNRDRLDATIVRLFNTIGPRQTGTYGMVVPRFVSQALRGEKLTVYGSGAQTRCFAYVKDTVAAICALCESEKASGSTFNIGGSKPTTILDLARIVIERSGSSSEIELVPYERAYGAGFEELGQRRPDITALRELTGWQPRYSLEHAVDEVISYERQRLAGQTALARLALRRQARASVA